MLVDKISTCFSKIICAEIMVIYWRLCFLFCQDLAKNYSSNSTALSKEIISSLDLGRINWFFKLEEFFLPRR